MKKGLTSHRARANINANRETVDAEVKPSARAKRARQGGSGPQCGAGKWAAEGAGKGRRPSILQRVRTLQRRDVSASRREAVPREGAAIKVAPQECFQNACPCSLQQGQAFFLSARIKGKEHERIQIFYKAMVMLMPAAPNTIFHDYFEKRVS